MKEYDETEEEKILHLRRLEWDKKAIKNMIDYRKAVRRDFFRRRAIYRKCAMSLVRRGVFTEGEVLAALGERSVATPVQRTFRGQSLPPHTGAEKKEFPVVKQCPQRDGEKMGRIDYPPSSSGCEIPTGMTPMTRHKPGQEQKPAISEEERPTKRSNPE